MQIRAAVVTEVEGSLAEKGVLVELPASHVERI
jgi:hypothetical protein